MGAKWLGLLMIIAIYMQSWICDGCLQQERVALLQLKAFLWEQEKIDLLRYNFALDNAPFPLDNWVEDGDCCRWERVDCDGTTGRVTNLSLSSPSSFGSADRRAYWNISLFLPFEGLKALDLSVNQLAGCVENGGFERLSNLQNLQVLDLSDNYFNDSILSSFNVGFSSLKSLNLASNSFTTSNYINSLCGLTGLQQLDLSSNNIKGRLPWCFSNLTSLEVLDLSSNRFSDDIASSPLGSLLSVEYLKLSDNFLQVPSSLRSFFKLSKLKYLDLAYNIIYQETELLHSSVTPTFQLNTFVLACCGDAGSFPEFLHHQQNLQQVSLSSIGLKGKFPSWLLENNTKLQVLDLSNNSLSGSFQLFSHLNLSASDIEKLQGLPLANNSALERPKLPFPSRVYLSFLDLSSNSLVGHIPTQIGAYLPELYFLNMSNNLFEGNIPSSIGYMKSLALLDLSNNKLFGAIPEHLAMGCYSLEGLKLSNNNLQGQVFPTDFNLTKLMELLLDGNNFTGRIPNVGLSKSLLKLDISNNHLSGRIPSWIRNMSQLEQLIMANNSLEGPVPVELCKLTSLKILDLSSNNLSGILPSCLSPSRINHLHLSKNRLRGSLTDKFCDSSMLVTLDLSNNQFSGSIPKCIDKFPQLSYLFLDNNGLQGNISRKLCRLDKLSLVDLSHNNLSGLIPPCLKITTLSEVSGYYEEYYAPPPVASDPPVASGPIAMFVGSPTSFSIEGPIEFTTKSISYSYKGRIISFMSGIDLSCNNLSGEIPRELGNLIKLHALNLSHNSLVGKIPATLSNLKEIESLDLSFNNLSGSIPPQMVGLYSMEVFNVSYNNLSGLMPPRVAQFGTFDDSSFKGNPFLCGEPLRRDCPGTMKPQNRTVDVGKDAGFSNMDMFYMSFVVSYVTALLTTITVLWINPHWRQAWFYYVDIIVSSCYYFVLDHLPRSLF